MLNAEAINSIHSYCSSNSSRTRIGNNNSSEENENENENETNPKNDKSNALSIND
jgi:hypothetical protein